MAPGGAFRHSNPKDGCSHCCPNASTVACFADLPSRFDAARLRFALVRRFARRALAKAAWSSQTVVGLALRTILPLGPPQPR